MPTVFSVVNHAIVVVECDDGRLKWYVAVGVPAVGLLVEEGKVDPITMDLLQSGSPRTGEGYLLTEKRQTQDTHPAEQIAGFRSGRRRENTSAKSGTCWLRCEARPAHARSQDWPGSSSGTGRVSNKSLNTVRRWRWKIIPTVRVQVYEAACRQSWNNKPARVIRNLINDSRVSAPSTTASTHL